jgi:hypothetical protein
MIVMIMVDTNFSLCNWQVSWKVDLIPRILGKRILKGLSLRSVQNTLWNSNRLIYSYLYAVSVSATVSLRVTFRKG